MISIIVPIYNVEKYLRKCIESIINQTYRDLQIILVDDGSPDNCGIICDEYAKLDSRIIVIHQKNQGVSAARNAGLEYATGEYVSFIDPDDLINSRMLQSLVELIQKEHVQCSICLPEKFSNENYNIPKIDISYERIITMNQKHAVSKIFDLPATIEMAAWNKLFDRTLIEKYKIRFDTSIRYSEDLKFVLECFRYCEKVTFLPLPLIYIRLRPESATHKLNSFEDFQYNQKCVEECCKIACEINVDIFRKCRTSKYLRAINRRESILSRNTYQDVSVEINKLRSYFRKNLIDFWINTEFSLFQKIFICLFALGIK